MKPKLTERSDVSLLAECHPEATKWPKDLIEEKRDSSSASGGLRMTEGDSNDPTTCLRSEGSNDSPKANHSHHLP